MSTVIQKCTPLTFPWPLRWHLRDILPHNARTQDNDIHQLDTHRLLKSHPPEASFQKAEEPCVS